LGWDRESTADLVNGSGISSGVSTPLRNNLPHVILIGVGACDGVPTIKSWVCLEEQRHHLIEKLKHAQHQTKENTSVVENGSGSMAMYSYERAERVLGPMQIAILRTIDTHPDRAYGVAITACLSKMIDREVADGQIYVAIRRLEDHGFISSRVGEFPLLSKRSRGRPRVYYALTASGQRALENAAAYTSSIVPFKQSTSRGEHEGAMHTGQTPSAVVV